MTMKIGEKVDLFISSDFGYGDMGSPPSIPGGARLTFTVELIAVGDSKQSANMMSDEERMESATKSKEVGTTAFREKKFEEALGHY